MDLKFSHLFVLKLARRLEGVCIHCLQSNIHLHSLPPEQHSFAFIASRATFRAEHSKRTRIFVRSHSDFSNKRIYWIGRKLVIPADFFQDVLNLVHFAPILKNYNRHSITEQLAKFSRQWTTGIFLSSSR